MNTIRNIGAALTSDAMQDCLLKTAGLTSLVSICAYGGTFFFTRHNPVHGAAYLSVVALTSLVAYQIFEKMKEYVDSPTVKDIIKAVQFLQIPLVFYALPGPFNLHLENAVKLEMVIVTAYFVAIPMFFHFAIEVWNDPTLPNLFAASGIMLSLANGLKSYV